MGSKEEAERAIVVMDGLIANIDERDRNRSPYKEMIEERNRLAQLLGLPGVDTVLNIGDAVIDFSDDVENVVGEIGDLSLNFVRGLGAALVDGVDGAYDAVRGKLRGKEPDVIAGITVAAITILTVVFLYNGAKNAKDVF